MTHSTFASLLPPLLAIVLAVVTRRVVTPLLAGVMLGAGLLALDGHAKEGTVATLMDFVVRVFDSILQSVIDPDHLRVLAFTLLLGAMVGVLEAAGGLSRVIASLALRVRSRRGGQWLIATFGLAIFFDDYANTLLVGGTMRPAADRYGISRAKLAYLVDSTAAPVAGLTLVSTWVATEISYLRDGLTAAGLDDPSLALRMFISSVPYRFYPWLALVMVFASITLRRDFAAMQKQEEQAIASGQTGPAPSVQKASLVDWFSAVLPIVACLIGILAVLVITGTTAIAGSANVPPRGSIGWWGEVIGQGQSYNALVVGGLMGWLVASVTGGSLRAITEGTFAGVLQMMPAMVVLWLAWALSSIGGPTGLDTSGYLSSVLGDVIPVAWLPTCVFLTAGAMALATGTSWATMAILTPIAVPLVLRMDPDPMSPIVLATFSSVLAGAIFGDHCSPLSDTTVLSSRACGCDHVVHVKTQMPYAVWTAGVAIVCGTIPIGLGWPVGVAMLLGVVAIGLIVRFVARPIVPVEAV